MSISALIFTLFSLKRKKLLGKNKSNREKGIRDHEKLAKTIPSSDFPLQQSGKHRGRSCQNQNKFHFVEQKARVSHIYDI